MKSFYSSFIDEAPGALGVPEPSIHLSTRARVAVYDSTAAAPRVEEVSASEVDSFIESLTTRVYDLARGQGGLVPYTVIREVTENFIHADFAEPVISVLDSGKTIRFADQGPGISDKDHAILPGYTTARGEMKRFIRGVGSGLPIVRDYLSQSGGSLVIEDNLGTGAVVTVYTEPSPSSQPAPRMESRPEPSFHLISTPSLASSIDADSSDEPFVARPRLSTRQKQVLALVLESGSAGPSLVSRELGVGISTAYRDLASLEELALITSDGGKRHVTPSGLSYLDELTSGL